MVHYKGKTRRYSQSYGSSPSTPSTAASLSAAGDVARQNNAGGKNDRSQNLTRQTTSHSDPTDRLLTGDIEGFDYAWNPYLRSTYSHDDTKLEHAEMCQEALKGQHESGLESRFNAGAGMPVTIGMEQGLSSTGKKRRQHLEFVEPENVEAHHTTRDGTASDSDSLIGATADDPPDNSPYPQVRASVPALDDVSLSINTPRMWTLSLLFTIMGSATNLFFSLRYPSVTITPVVALLLVHPLGRLWDECLKRDNDPIETFIDGHLAGRNRTVRMPDSHDSTTSEQPGLDRTHGSRTSRLARLRLWLAQGRWNQKEHACVYIASNVSFGFAFATDVIVEQTQFYHQVAPILYQILLVLSTQILGYAAAGLTRRYLVRPSGMIWPSTLVSTSMFSTLHRDENKPANGWRVSRWRFFLFVFSGSCAFYFLPGFLVPALSYFNIITWFAPDSVVVSNLFGTSSGLGLFPMTFDWSQIAYIGSPLVVPFWAAMNVVGGLVVVMWLIAPICYYMNALYSSYLPILSSVVFDNTGKPYDVGRILTSDFLFNEQAYKDYSLVFLPITYVLSYGVQFAALTALITHTACWHGKDIWLQWRQSLAEIKKQDSQKTVYQPVAVEDDDTAYRTESHSSSQTSNYTSSFSTASSHDANPFSQNQAPSSKQQQTPPAPGAYRPQRPALNTLLSTEDVHSRLMRRYSDVPMSWYLLTGVIMLSIGIFTVEYYPTHLPWYGLLLAFSLCALLFIPIGIVMAITNQQSSIYLICQLTCGLIFPGRPVANMVFVTYGYITSTQGLKFSSDLKLGQYMKIPPRTLFTLQLCVTVVSSLTQIGVLNWSLSHIPSVCTPEAMNGFSCPIARVHFNGSILWGVVGPGRFFGPDGLYHVLVWGFLLGALAPIIVWYAGRKKRGSVWEKVNLPVIFGSLSWIPPATGLNFSIWALICFVFNHLLRRRRADWWRKYTMTLSAALDAGAAFGVGLVFFALLYPRWQWLQDFKWWGTEVYKQGCDWRACPYKRVPEGQRFGPDKW